MVRRGERVERSSGAAPPRPFDTGGPSDLLTVEVEERDERAVVISLAGELDLSTVPQLENALIEQLRSHPSVVVDMSKLRFIDSSGIGLMIRAHRATDHAGALCTVLSRGSQVERVFSLAGVDRALRIYFDRDEALTALNGDSGVGVDG
jgi:anti-anti-sigma factor